MQAPEAMEARRARRAVVAAFAFLSLYFSGVFLRFANPNELSRFQTVVAAVDDGTFSIDAASARLGQHEDRSVSGGRFYSNKAPGLALAAIPVYALLRLAMSPPESGTSDLIFVLLRLLTVTLLLLYAFVRFGRRLVATDAASAGLVLFAVAFGTPLLFYGRTFFAHAWTAALLFLSWDLLRARSVPSGSPARWDGLAVLAAGFAAGMAAISEYVVAPVALLLFVRAFAGRSLRRPVLFALGAAPALAALAAYDAICFGSPFVLSSAREADPAFRDLAAGGLFGLGVPSLSVAVQFLLHPARGVLVFSPFLLWSAAGFVIWWRSARDRADCALAAAATAVYFVLMTGYPNWHGGWSLGHRYLLPVVFFAASAIPFALSSPVSRGLFAAAAAFSAGGHVLMTASWPHFPLNVPVPAANGSLWFLSRGWTAPNLGSAFGGGALAAIVVPAAAAAVALALALRASGRMTPWPALAAFSGLAALAVVLAWPPPLSYPARLWRAAVFARLSPFDPDGQELREVAGSAETDRERRQAGAWMQWLSR